jgi:exosome complex component RRP41
MDSISRRADGREPNQIRPPCLEDGLLFRADGSARLTLGNTMALVGVFGPALGRSKSGDGAELSIDVVLTCSPGVATDKIVMLKSAVVDVLRAAVRVKQYPRCALVVALRLLSDDGGALATLVNAAFAAVMDAGVEMHCLPVAASFAWVSKHSSGDESNGFMLVDPDLSEEKMHPTLTIVCTASGDVLAVQASGVIHPNTIPRCIEAAGVVARTFTEISRRKVDVELR